MYREFSRGGMGDIVRKLRYWLFVVRGASQDPGYVVCDFVYSFLGEGTNFFNQPILINHHDVCTPCKACLWEICFTFFEKDISRKNGVFCLFCNGHNHDCAKFASINGIPLNYYHRSFVCWLRSCRRGESCPKNITLTYYHFSSSSCTELMPSISSARSWS